MKLDPKGIEHLNILLKNELTAINQYFLHARMHRNWGFERLGDMIYQESIGEMKHADILINRILLLEGHPNLQDMGKINIGEDVPEALKSDLTLETKAREDLVAAATYFEDSKDYVSRDITTAILADAEEQMDFLDTEIGLIDSDGMHNYLQTQIKKSDD